MIYLIVKLVHVLAAIIFLGNITLGFFWKFRAEKLNERQRIEETFTSIIKADRLFTMPGVVILLIFGIGSAQLLGYNLITTGWIFWSIILYVISGLAFMIKVVPVQKKILKLTSDENNFNWDEYKKLSAQWNLWGTIATITPWIATVLMILKPGL
ncbi:MAG: DUF2269 family protein [Ignavibacteria bacterium]|jgi:uncharacterized membrane protein